MLINLLLLWHCWCKVAQIFLISEVNVSKRLLKSGMIVSAMTLISRVLGLVRDIVVANLMGAGASADVFFFANKIPNFLRRLFAEGAFSQAFVPVLTEYHASGDINIISGGSVTITAPGNVTVNGDVIAGGISLKTHVHGGISPGPADTGQPK